MRSASTTVDPEIAHDGIAEGAGENRKCDQRYAEQQEERHAVAQDPTQLARRDQDQPGARGRPHPPPARQST